MDHRASKLDTTDHDTIEAMIASDASPVGIDAKKTHVLILAKLVGIEQRLEKLEELVKREAP